MYGNRGYCAIKIDDSDVLKLENCFIENFTNFLICNYCSFKAVNCHLEKCYNGFSLAFKSEGFIKKLSINNFEGDIVSVNSSNSDITWEDCPEITLQKI